MALTWTVADGCEPLRTVGQRQANTPPPPDPRSETGTLATHSGKIDVEWNKPLEKVYILTMPFRYLPSNTFQSWIRVVIPIERDVANCGSAWCYTPRFEYANFFTTLHNPLLWGCSPFWLGKSLLVRYQTNGSG